MYLTSLHLLQWRAARRVRKRRYDRWSACCTQEILPSTQAVVRRAIILWFVKGARTPALRAANLRFWLNKCMQQRTSVVHQLQAHELSDLLVLMQFLHHHFRGYRNLVGPLFWRRVSNMWIFFWFFCLFLSIFIFAETILVFNNSVFTNVWDKILSTYQLSLFAIVTTSFIFSLCFISRRHLPSNSKNRLPFSIYLSVFVWCKSTSAWSTLVSFTTIRKEFSRELIVSKIEQNHIRIFIVRWIYNLSKSPSVVNSLGIALLVRVEKMIFIEKGIWS